MKKEKTLKYLILTLTMIISFFMFSNASVKAAEKNGVKIIDNLFFEVEEVESGKYSIVGVFNTCNGDAVCEQSISSVQNLVIPDVYNDGVNNYPIVSIKDSDDSISGVLDSLKNVVSGKISGGRNLKTIGTCAFCDFTGVNEFDVSSSVVLIKNNAFFGSGIKNLYINRYEGSSLTDNATALESETALAGVVLENIVFKNRNILRFYNDSLSVWRDLNISANFTYKIAYRFFDDLGNYEERVYFSGQKLNDIPVDLVKTGFDFDGWVSKEINGEYINQDSIAMILNTNETYVHEVYPKWEITSPSLVMKSYHNTVEKTDGKILYGGKNNKLDLIVSVDHPLIDNSDFSVGYSWKSDIKSIITPIFNSTNQHSISYVSQSGIYICSVTITYLDFSKTVEVQMNVEILAKDLHIVVNNNTTEYGTYVGAGRVDNGYFVIDNSTSLIEGEEIKVYKTHLYTNSNSDIIVGNYNDVLEVEIVDIGYENSTDNYINNYNITYSKGDLTVYPKRIDVSLQENVNITYGDVENLGRVVNDTIYQIENEFAGFNKALDVVYTRSDALVKDSGNYSIISAECDNSNYIVYLDPNSPYKVFINPKSVLVEWNVDNNLVYNGEVKNVGAKYQDIANQFVDLKVSIKKNDVNTMLVNAGEYVAVAEMIIKNNNYILENDQRSIVIEKANSEFIGDLYQKKDYNGYPQKVDVKLNHHEGVVRYGDYSTCKNAHVSVGSNCIITVSVDETGNYKGKTQNFYLHINPYKLFVQPDLFKITYGNTVGLNNLNKAYKGVDGENVIVYFYKESTADKLDVGFYNIGGARLTNNNNYSVEMVQGSGVNKIEIIPAPIEVRFYFYENLVYDGLVKDIKIRVFGTNEDVGLNVDYNGKTLIKNAGDYKIDVSVTNPNYYIQGNDYLEFSIAKANYDISNLKLNSKKVKFNFKNHFINLEGDLPEGLVAVYSINSNAGNGTFAPFKHEVKVTFEGDFENYNYVQPMTAVLNVSMTWLIVTIVLFVVVVGGSALTLFILYKSGKVRFRNRLKRSAIRRIIKRNKELDAINKLISKTKDELYKKDEDIIIEEPVKFVKAPVKFKPDELVELSFVDELFKSEKDVKNYYSEIKNELLSYDGVVSKIKRDYETFYLNNMPIAKIDVVNGVLQLYFALDPTVYKVEEYNHKNVSKKKEFSTVPLNLTVDSIESLRHAKMFVRIIRKKEKLKFVSNFVRVDYVKIYTAKENTFKLFKKVFVKKGKNE